METKLLRELCVEIVDCPHSTPSWTSAGKIVIRNFNIQNGKIDFSNPSFTDQEHYLHRIKRAKPEGGDLVITREAPMGQVGMIPSNVECCLGQRMVLLKVDRTVCNPYYLLYALQSPAVQFQIKCNEGTGTTVSNLRIPILEHLEIPFVNKETQDRIAAFLKLIDDKIEVNNKIIKNLEEQIELCSEEILKNNSDDPQCNLGEICQFVTGYSYKSDELVPSDTALVTIKNFSRNGGFDIDGLKPINASKKVKDQQAVDLFDILVAHTDLTQKAEIVGNAEMVMDLGNYKEAIASMDLVKVVPISDVYPKSIIYCILKSRQFKQHCLGYVNGTTVLHLSKRALPEFAFKITDDKIKIKLISNITHNSVKLISLLMKSNRILYSIRNAILPKLLTGEIELKNK